MARRQSPNAKTRQPVPVHPPFWSCTVEETAALIHLAAAFGQLTHGRSAWDQIYTVPDEAIFRRCPDCAGFLPQWPRCKSCGWREPGARWVLG